MNTVTATLFALADGCNKYSEDVVMCCIEGQA